MYVTNEKGEKILVGDKTLEERNEYVDRKVRSYLKKHPGVSIHKAKKYARVKWARKVKS